MIRNLFPDRVVIVTATPEMEGVVLFPEEEACIRRAVPKRRREFVLGRACARAALARLGYQDHPLPCGPNRAPVWPAGVVGSLSHCDGFCGVAVAPRGWILGLGLDAEVAEPFPPELVPRVCTIRETVWVRATSRTTGVDWYRFIFSAKESVYKACQTLMEETLEFTQLEIAIEPSAARFTIQPKSQALAEAVKGKALYGRFGVSGNHVFTAVTILQSAR